MKDKSTLRRLLEWGGIAAGTIMVAFGIAAIVMGFDGRSTVQDSLANEFIVGSDDMTPEVINAEIPGIVAAQKKIAAARQQAGAEAIEFTPVEAPDCSVAGRRSTTAPMRGASRSTSAFTPCGRRAVSPTRRWAVSWQRLTRRLRRRTSPAGRATKRWLSSTSRAVSPYRTARGTSGSPRPRCRRRSTSPTRPSRSRCSGSSSALPCCSRASA